MDLKAINQSSSRIRQSLQDYMIWADNDSRDQIYTERPDDHEGLKKVDEVLAK